MLRSKHYLIEALAKLSKPEYIFRPSQLIIRLLRTKSQRGDLEIVRLPWELDLCVRTNESIGAAVWHLGVFELVTSEAIWRLLGLGEHAVDVGANIGYMTGLMAKRTGHSGNVTSFEPHPQLFHELIENIERWHSSSSVASIDSHQLAVSGKCGIGTLFIPDLFDINMGLATVEPTTGEVSNKTQIPVKLTSLDEICGSTTPIHLLKVDVEGHEAAVFEGAVKLLSQHLIRDVIFEDFGQYPSRSMSLLERYGYKLWRLKRTFLGPKLVSPDDLSAVCTWEPPAYLATVNPERVYKIMSTWGWKVLKAQNPGQHWMLPEH